MYYQKIKNKIELAIKSLKSGKNVIVTDDKNRENESDLILPGQIADTEKISFMLQYTSGFLCLSVTEDYVKKLNLFSMYFSKKSKNTELTSPIFTMIESSKNITTGISARDRATTIRVASNKNVVLDDINQPGHIPLLLANKTGVFGRRGHTEGSTDLVKIAGFNPVSALSELVNPNGSIMKDKNIFEFSSTHNLPCVSIEDIFLYRLYNEVLLSKKDDKIISLEDYGNILITNFKDHLLNLKITVVSKIISENPEVHIVSPLFLMIYQNYLKKINRRSQLHKILRSLSSHGGIAIYFNLSSRDRMRLSELSKNNLYYCSIMQVLKYYNINEYKIFPDFLNLNIIEYYSERLDFQINK